MCELWPAFARCAAGMAAALVALSLLRVRQRTIVARERARRRALALEDQREELQKRAASKEQLHAPHRSKLRPGGLSSALGAGQSVAAVGSDAAADLRGQQRQRESEKAASEERRIELARRTGSDAAADLRGQQRQKESEKAASEERRIELARRTGLLNFLPSVRPSEQIASFAPSLRVLALADAISEKCCLQWLCPRNVLDH